MAKMKDRCVVCGGGPIIKAGRRKSGTGKSWYQLYKCKKCGKVRSGYKRY